MSDPISTNKTLEIKQTFLSNAIADIAGYIHLTDTKVSIIMAACVAVFMGVLACYEPIYKILKRIQPCSWLGVLLCIACLLCALSLVGVFLFGTLTICGHSSHIGYKSKWFLGQSTKKYSFDAYKKDLLAMTDGDIIENMGAELYKLNDIYLQKASTMKWTIFSFALSLITLASIAIIFLFVIL